MHTIRAILSETPAILGIFVITPDEVVALAHAHATNAPPACPAGNLNRLYHDAAGLLPDSREVSLSFGATCVTLRPLRLDWVLAVHHQRECDAAPFDALQAATQGLPKTDRELEDEEFSILTPDDVMSGELAPWLVPLMRLLEEVSGKPPQATFHQAVNEWIDLEDPSHEGLHHFSAIIAATISDPSKRSLYVEKAKGILTSGERVDKGGEMP
ncbi:hypothetical protein DSLASN_04510 [Desulfoluna limicola]|uniref:Uncharacterized protein n=1 Tax=Desulfoluna limicola TaxID=2810562 RepID=A0ABM7PCD3_9BACT|nr:hypothetical protein [Desulfoluna limicola]BCS94819.1 hypothetical protein DSLASN_04510 [Desulfoluna limicola]